MYRIELLKTHTHASEVHFAGSIIEVDETTASWLIQYGVGKAVDEIASPTSEDLASPSTNVAAKTKPNRKVKE